MNDLAALGFSRGEKGQEFYIIHTGLLEERLPHSLANFQASLISLIH